MHGPEANGDRARGLGAAVFFSVVVLVAVPLDLLPALRGPAPYPPEWQWAFRPEGPSRPLLAAVACALGLLGLLAASGSARARRRLRTTLRILVGGAVLLGLGLQLALLAREPGAPLHTMLARARSRSFTSYHSVAVSPAGRDPKTFLREHAGRLPTLKRWAKHAATHPPGPVLYYRAALAVCEASPGLTAALLGAAGLADGAPRPRATDPGRASALLGALLLALLGALAAWPIARLAVSLGVDDISAGRLAVLWALLPGPALQTPQFDQALALPVVGATTLLLLASRAPAAREGAWRALLAGVLGGMALFTSYGVGPFLAIGGMAALAAAGGTTIVRSAGLAGVVAGVAGLVAFGLPSLFGHQPLQAVVTALAIHREAYTAPRSYTLWLAFNPLDLGLFLGVPVAVAGLLLTAGTVWRAARGSGSTALDRFRIAVFAGVGVLVALGVTRGEVGRIWIPLMPLLLVASLGRPEAPGRRESLVHGALLAALTLALGSYWVL